jgi:HEPN superfamily AbiU2-like protein
VSPTQEKVEKILARLKESVVMGKAHLSIGRGLAEAFTQDPIIGSVAHVFWGMTITAHLDAAQLLAFKLFDSQPRSMTLEYLLELSMDGVTFQKAKPEQVLELISTQRARITSIRPRLAPIDAKRNRIIAHADPTVITDPEKIGKQTRVTFDDLDSIFKIAGQILNNVSVAFHDVSSVFDLADVDDYQSVIQRVADAKHEEADKYEREFKETAPFPRPKTARSAW